MEFLNLMPREMKMGDIWDEGLEIMGMSRNADSLTWRIHFKGHIEDGVTHCLITECLQKWPDNAPKRILRLVERQENGDGCSR